MKLGEKARLDITSDFAYGDQYVPTPFDNPIPECLSFYLLLFKS